MIIRRDFLFSEEGDLILGSERRNGKGEVLYVNRFGEESTDPSTGQPIKDLAFSAQNNAIKQVILNRLRTDAPDWFHHPDMGGNLTDLIGEPNTRETAEKGVEQIKKMLTYDNYLSEDVVVVKPIPVDANTILFYIILKDDGSKDVEFPILFELETGLLYEYEIPKDGDGNA